MLKIYDQNHVQLGTLTRYKEPKVESELNTADRYLSFVVTNPDEVRLKNEYYVRTREDEFVIKKISHKSWSSMEVSCLLNLEELQGKPFRSFSVEDEYLYDAVSRAITGTGWTIGYCDVDKKRNAGMVDCDALQVVKNLCTAWMCECSFDSLHKKVNLYNKMGSKKGAYFMDGLNLRQITKDIDSYDYYTRIIPIGADGITIETVNNGKAYLENYQYSNKVLTYLWKDESYTDPQALKEDAELKLDDMSKPAEAYSCDVIDLANQRKDYGVLSYKIGDEVKLINRETRTLTRQRITKTVRYLENPEKNTCELSNTTLTFTELQEKLNNAAEIVNYMIDGDGRYTGTIKVSDVIDLETGIKKSAVFQDISKDLNETILNVQKLGEASASDQKKLADVEAKISQIISLLSNVISTDPEPEATE